MKSQHIRAFGLLVGLVAVLGMASVVAGETLTDQQISRQIEQRLSGDMFRNVTVSVQASVVSLSGSVPSLWAKTQAIAEALELSDVASVVSHTLDIERAESDRALAEQIEKRIRRVTIPGPHRHHGGYDIWRAVYGHTSNSFYGIFDYVDGGIDDGVVTLTGYVTHEYKAGKMVELVSRVSGVREIQNQIEVLPASTFDNGLRVRIARQIYGNVLRPHVSTAAPVHIIVNRLHVTLAGTVLSGVEQLKAETSARHVFGVLSVQNNLKTELEING